MNAASYCVKLPSTGLLVRTERAGVKHWHCANDSTSIFLKCMEDSNGYTRLTSLATKFKNIHLYSLASSTALSLTGIMLRIPTTKKPLMMLICHGGD